MLRALSIAFALIGAAIGGAFGYANWPPAPLPTDAKADRVVVFKAQRKLVLMNGTRVIREYAVALGRNPLGAKEFEGDGKTPEGIFTIDYRNPKSQFHLALHVSYPKTEDIARAKKAGMSPGGLIMIHGLRNGIGALGRFHRLTDWTDGCVAVTNAEIEEIWRVVPDGTVIEIKA